MFLLFVFFFISILFSFLCSIWEAVLLSITPSHARILEKEGSKIGVKLQHFKDNIDRPLAAILTLNTIAHTVGAIGVGAQAAQIFGDSIYASIIIPVVMTLAILILSEIIPKTLGATYWKGLTPFTVNSLDIITKLLSPLVWISQLITKAIKKDGKKSVLSRADIAAMAELGEQEGVIEQGESKILKNLFRFKNIQASSIMTPRTVVKAANEVQTIGDFYKENKDLRLSRIPVFKDTKDHVSGFILKDVLLQSIINQKQDQPLQSIMREIMVVNEQTPIPDVFNKLMEKREHIALVVDEFGGMAGIVTMEDVIETLLGLEIMDELDNVQDMQAWARKSWERRAKALGILEEDANQ